EGRVDKFVNSVEHVTFSGDYARENKQTVMYITERAIFRLTDSGLELIEIAPGIDLDRDILGHMGFKPQISDNLKVMSLTMFE
ncbi:MAG: acyl CoA:acetate/3-ketoacid CoA transferase, partial [Victivallaceae bacterium]|nr:acyl CoA:acetate/3-ketoacid CoA transferase [Victivallaceae bacterium]